MDIANEVDDKLGRLVPPPEVQVVVQELLGVVLDGADNTAILFTVTVEIHATVRGRGVLGIYEVEVLGKTPPSTTLFDVSSCPGLRKGGMGDAHV